MKTAVLLAFLIAGASAAPLFVWDIIKAPLKTDEILDIVANAVPGQSYPIYAEIPQTDFVCSSQKYSGYFADVSTQCQVFHRCDLDGVVTSYLCPNTTIFDQIRLICDYFYNVDCQRGAQYVDFVNSRLYTNQDAFDTPDASYVVPWEREGATTEASAPSGPVQTRAPVRPNRPAPTRAPAQPGRSVPPRALPVARPVAGRQTTTQATTTTSAEEVPVEETSTVAPVDESSTEAPADVTGEAPADESSTETPADATTGAEDTTAAPADETSAAPAEDTSAASGDATTLAPTGRDLDESSTESTGDETTTVDAAADTTEAAADQSTDAPTDVPTDETTEAPTDETTTDAGADASTTGQ